jgi:uncharacterized membrane protein YphA (DoxX/SURF4 family)
MKIAMVIFSVVLALIVLASGAGKLRKSPQVIDGMKHVGVKESQIPILAVLEIAGGLGLLIGLANTALGRFSAICLAAYFAGAVVSHLRVNDKFKVFAPAFFIFVIALVTVWLQLKR